MQVHELMTHAPAVCTTSDHLTRAAQIMWERDCGVVPVLDEAGRLAGILTDRDACMAAYTQGRPLHEISVADAMSKVVTTIGPDAGIRDALDLMRRKEVRRLPVVDAQGRLVGILSMADFARAVQRDAGRSAPSRDAVAETLAGVSRSRSEAAATPARETELPPKVLVPLAPPAKTESAAAETAPRAPVAAGKAAKKKAR